MTMENKEAFMHCLQAAFIAGDSKRYRHLRANPVEHFRIGGIEYMGRDGFKMNVTGCSCSVIAEMFAENFI